MPAVSFNLYERLRKVLLKVEKRLLKIEEALEEGDSGQVSTLLRLADEDLVRFLEAEGHAPLIADIG